MNFKTRLGEFKKILLNYLFIIIDPKLQIRKTKINKLIGKSKLKTEENKLKNYG